MKLTHLTRLSLYAAALLALLPILNGCTDNNGNTAALPPTDQSAVVATVAADFSAGAHAVFTNQSPYTGQTDLLPTGSDITVAAYGEYFYRIERFSGENVSRFHISAPATPEYQYSTAASDGSEPASSNPYGLVFVSETKAYLLRYGSDKAWIVNPAAASEAEFKVGELNLSAYTVPGAGAPNMSAGVIVDDRLYITLQRMDSTFTPQQAYVAVFDTTTDQEIDTQPASAGLNGIPLLVKNPNDIEYLKDTGLLYVQGVGQYENSFAGTPAVYAGGIESIDPVRFTTNLIVDDGDDANHPMGLLTGMELFSAERGYIIGYAGFGDNNLYSFNPSTGAITLDAGGNPAVVAELSHTGLGGLAIDNRQQLWVSVADPQNPGMRVLNATDGSVIEPYLATTLNPSTIAICNNPVSGTQP